MPYLAFAAPVDSAELCNTLANDLGFVGDNFTVTVTARNADYKCGGMPVAPEFVHVLQHLPALPDALAGSVSLSEAQLAQVSEALLFEVGDVGAGRDVYDRLLDRLTNA